MKVSDFEKKITSKQKKALYNLISFYNFGVRDGRKLSQKEKDRIKKLSCADALVEIKKWIKKVKTCDWFDSDACDYDQWFWKD